MVTIVNSNEKVYLARELATGKECIVLGTCETDVCKSLMRYDKSKGLKSNGYEVKLVRMEKLNGMEETMKQEQLDKAIIDVQIMQEKLQTKVSWWKERTKVLKAREEDIAEREQELSKREKELAKRELACAKIKADLEYEKEQAECTLETRIWGWDW